MTEPPAEERAAADIGVTGLAVMGRNLARNLARHGYAVALHNRSVERTRRLVDEHGDEGRFIPSESMADFVASLRRPRAIIVMVQRDYRIALLISGAVYAMAWGCGWNLIADRSGRDRHHRPGDWHYGGFAPIFRQRR